MPAAILIAQGVVVDIRIPVQGLGVPQLWDQRVGLEEAAQDGVVEPRPVVIQAQRRLPPLAGEAAILGC